MNTLNRIHFPVRALILGFIVIASFGNAAFGMPEGSGAGINPVSGFEIGNGMVINRIGGYRFKLPGNWEVGQSIGLTQVIAPIALGVPRPQIQIDVVKAESNSSFTDIGEDLSEKPWEQANIGGMNGLIRTAKSENGLVRAELKIKKSDKEYFLIILDYGVGSSNTDVYALLDQTLNSFQKSEITD